MGYHYLKKERAKAEADAADNFKDHVLHPAGEGRWFFHRPGQWCPFGFGVISAPRLVVMYGDAGEVMLEPSDRDALGWLRSVLKNDGRPYDLSYIASKVPQSMRIRDFEQGLVDEYIAELRAEVTRHDDDDEGPLARKYEALAESLDGEDFSNAHDFYRHLYENDCGIHIDDPPTVEGLSWHFMHQVAGLFYFCRALDAHERQGVLVP